MKSPLKRISLNKPGISVFLIILFIGIFSLSYYVYHTLSVNFFKEEYQNRFLTLKTEIISSINNSINQQETVNINRIIDPYLNDQIDLLVVYRGEQEIIQIFTKKGITKEQLRELDTIYGKYQQEISTIYFLENENSLDPPSQLDSGIGNLDLLIMSTIEIELGEVPYTYLLLFNSDNYRFQRIKLEEVIDRNSFFGGLTFLGLVAFLFMFREIYYRVKGNRALKNHHGEAQQTILQLEQMSTPDEKGSSLEEKPVQKPIAKVEKESSQPNIEIQDTIEHPGEDIFFKEENPVEEEWENPPPSENKEISPPSPHPEESQEIKQTQEIFAKITSPLIKSSYENLVNTTPSEKSLPPAIPHPIREFTEILGLREDHEQRRITNPRLKTLLGTWLFAQENQKEEIPSMEELFAYLLSRSLEILGSPDYFTPSFEGSRLNDYVTPSAILFFCSDIHAREPNQQPVLISSYPDHLHDPERVFFCVPWLGEEKKFFKQSLPYVEKKPGVVAMISPRIVSGVHYIVKAVYSSENYERLLYEQKLEFLYMTDVLLDCSTGFPELHQKLLQSNLDLEKKAEFFFHFIFRLPPGVIRLLTGKPSPLHFSLWNFDIHDYPINAKIRFRKLIKELPECLNQEFHSQELLFLSEPGNRLLSLGYSPTSPEKNSLSEKIKSSIEKYLMERVGLHAMKIRWQETPLSIPTEKPGQIDFSKTN